MPAPTIERVIVLNEVDSPRVYRYKVRSGDTLYAISRLHGISVHQIAQMNDIAAPYVIHPGDNLVVDLKLVAVEPITNADAEMSSSGTTPAANSTPSSSASAKKEPSPKASRGVTVIKLPRPSTEDLVANENASKTQTQSKETKDSEQQNTPEPASTETVDSSTKTPSTEIADSSKTPSTENTESSINTATTQDVEPPPPPKPEVTETPGFVARTEPTDTKTESSAEVDVNSLPKGWTAPVSANPTNSFGKDDGLNYHLNQGNTVVAAASGRVTYAGVALGDFKHMVLIKTPDEYVIQYDFNVDLNVQENDLVTKGQDLVKIVNSSKGQNNANSDEYRKLFFAIWKKGVPQNPDKLIGKTNANEG